MSALSAVSDLARTAWSSENALPHCLHRTKSFDSWYLVSSTCRRDESARTYHFFSDASVKSLGTNDEYLFKRFGEAAQYEFIRF